MTAIAPATSSHRKYRETNVYGTLVKVLMLTGQRLSDWAKARRSELIEDGGLYLLVVDGERYKNQESHEVPLPAAVVELLGRLRSDWLFSATGNRPINDFRLGAKPSLVRSNTILI
jgi:integrase